jgi:branched-chain amino acid aminotransferase
VPDRTVWINGQLVDEREVTVPLLAQSLQRGTLVFDVYAVLHLRPDISRGSSGASCPVGFGAREHTERFVRSARLMDYPLEYGVDDLLQAAGAVVRATQAVTRCG